MNQRITISSREPGFAWAGRKWGAEPVIVAVVDDNDDDIGDALVYITPAQLAELHRQCVYPQYPLHIGRVDDAVEQAEDTRRELSGVQAEIAAERKALDDLKAERTKTDKALSSARKRLKDAERKLQEAESQLLATKVRVVAAETVESKQTESEVEPKPDPDRERN